MVRWLKPFGFCFFILKRLVHSCFRLDVQSPEPIESNNKRFTEDHARRRKEEAQEAKKAREAEDQAKQAYAEEVNE